jgi:hypothetical protein
MWMQKKTFADFYNELWSQLPQIKQLTFWDDYDVSSEECQHSMILSELSQGVISMLSSGKMEETKRVMNFIERYFVEGDSAVTSIIYTDFLVIILESENKEARETIKGMMGPETQLRYKQLLDFYNEQD